VPYEKIFGMLREPVARTLEFCAHGVFGETIEGKWQSSSLKGWGSGQIQVKELARVRSLFGGFGCSI